MCQPYIESATALSDIFHLKIVLPVSSIVSYDPVE